MCVCGCVCVAVCVCVYIACLSLILISVVFFPDFNLSVFQEDGLSAMLMSFVPCEADSSEDISD